MSSTKGLTAPNLYDPCEALRNNSTPTSFQFTATSQPNWQAMKFNHIGIPTTFAFEGEIALPKLSMTVSGHKNNPFGIQWQRYDTDAPYPELVKTVPHVAFEVDDLQAALDART